MKGEAFDPEEWADLVVKSGARYAGPVTEHADNFSMWDSSVNQSTVSIVVLTAMSLVSVPKPFESAILN